MSDDMAIKKQHLLTKENGIFLKTEAKRTGRNQSFICNQALDLFRGLCEIQGFRFSDIEWLVNNTEFKNSGELLYEASRKKLVEIDRERSEKSTYAHLEDYEKDFAERKLAHIVKLTLDFEDAKKVLGEFMVQPTEQNSIQEKDVDIEKLLNDRYERKDIYFLKLSSGKTRVFTFALNKMKKKT